MSKEEAGEERFSSTWRHRPTTAEPDERDAKIERLEQMLDEERRAAVELREANEALRFRLQVLEKSYAKQLEDARAQRADVERQLAAEQAEFAALDAECRETMRLLAQTRACLKDFAESRAIGSRYRGSLDGRRPDASPDGPAVESEGTINQLIADEDWPSPPAGDIDDGDEHSDAHADRALDSSSIDLIAPDLVFTQEDRDEDSAS